MHRGRIPRAHRLAELICYGAIAVFCAVAVILIIERVRGYPIKLPSAPSTMSLPLEIVPAGSTNPVSD